MPPTPTHVDNRLLARFNDLEQRLSSLERSQQMVITDPTGVNGDPSHGHACIVIGSLAAICGINAFGLGYWTGSGWTRLS